MANKIQKKTKREKSSSRIKLKNNRKAQYEKAMLILSSTSPRPTNSGLRIEPIR